MTKGDLVDVKDLRGEAGDALTVADLMTGEAVTFHASDKLILADQLMQLGRIRHIPVVSDDGGAVVGILSQRDLFRSALARVMERSHADDETLTIGDVMVTDVLTIAPGDSVARAAEIMLAEKVGCLPVVDEGGEGLVGILTEADFVRYVGSR